MKSLHFVIFFTMMGQLMLAQDQQSGLLQNSVRKGVIYKKERTWDIAVHTNGFLVGYNKGKLHNFRRTSYTHIDFGLIEHPREAKVYANYSNAPQQSRLYSSYTYGKQYSLWNLRITRGNIHYLSEKTRKKGLAIGYSTEAGFICGLAKPYYLRITRNLDGRIVSEDVKYSNKTKEEFLDVSRIEGASSFWKGITEISLKPGISAKAAVRLDPGAFERYARSLEIGIMADLYLLPVDILVTQKKELYFVNFFAKIQFGKRT